MSGPDQPIASQPASPPRQFASIFQSRPNGGPLWPQTKAAPPVHRVANVKLLAQGHDAYGCLRLTQKRT